MLGKICLLKIAVIIYKYNRYDKCNLNKILGQSESGETDTDTETEKDNYRLGKLLLLLFIFYLPHA